MPPNNNWDASNVHEARSALGERLRELRSAAGLSGRQLAGSLSWPPSKVSKLETGRQAPTDDDVRDWTQATGSESETEALLASLHTLEVQHAEWQRIPGVLQTAEYARARFAEGIRRLKLPNDINEAVAARVQRQEILYRPDKRFHFVLTEAALRLRLCPPEVMLGQLDRLVTLSTMPTIRFGVIPFEAKLPLAPVHGFWLMDERVVIVENFTASQNLTQVSEVSAYVGIFDQFANAARYDSDARSITTRALADLSASMS